MKIIRLLPMLLLIVSFNMCTIQKKTTNMKEITIEGTAEHSKLGAIVINSDGTYYIDGKSNWDKEGYYKKQIRVTGVLEIRKHTLEDLKNEKGEISQGIVGEINYIKMSKCALVQ